MCARTAGRPARRSLIVEFFGPPGAGKSTLAVSVARSLTERGYDVLGVAEQRELRSLRDGSGRLSIGRSLGLVAYALTHLDVCWLILKCIRQAGWTFSRLKQGAVLFRALQTNARCVDAADGVILREEGVVQAVWGLSIDGKLPSEALIRRLFATAFGSTSTAAVFLDISASKAFERMRARGSNFRLDKLDDPTLKRCLTEYVHRFESLVDCVSKEGVPVLRVDGSSEIASSTLHLVQELDNMGKNNHQLHMHVHEPDARTRLSSKVQRSDTPC